MKKIVILGPESTGKSTLCEQLAAHYHTVWVREYAREYLLKNGVNYTEADLWEIAKGQMESEDRAVSEEGRGSGEWGVASGENGAVTRKNHKPHSPLTEPHSPLTEPHSPLFIDTDMYVMKIWSEIVFNKCDNRILNQVVSRQYDLYLLCDTDLPWIKDKLREYPELKQRQKIYQFYLDAMINQRVPWVNISGNYEERLAKAIGAVDSIL